MALSEADRREIASIIAAEVARMSEQLKRGTSGGEPSRQEAEAAERAVAPLTALTGNWKLAGTAAGGGTEAAALSGPVEFDRFENNSHAGGRVMVTNFIGRVKQNTEAGGARLQQGERFAGILVLAHDPVKNQYVELYADDLGKVQVSTTNKYEVEGDTLRLYHDNYVAEYGARGPRQFRFAAYERSGGTSATEAARGAPIKTATLTRQ